MASRMASLTRSSYRDEDTVSGNIRGQMNNNDTAITYASAEAPLLDGGVLGRKRQKMSVQASDIGLTEDDASRLSAWCDTPNVDPFAAHRTKIDEEAQTVHRIHASLEGMRGRSDRVIFASKDAIKSLDEYSLDAVRINEEDGLVHLNTGATSRKQDYARAVLASKLEPHMNSMLALGTRKASNALKKLLENYHQYQGEVSRARATFAALGTPGSRPGTHSFGGRSNFPGNTGTGNSIAGDISSTYSQAPNSFLDAMTGQTNGLNFNATANSLPVTGQLMSGFQHNSPGDGITKHRVTYQEVLDTWISVARETVMIDSVSAHLAFLRAVGSVMVVPKPFQVMKMSMSFDKGFADASAEEVTFTEMTFRSKSEKRGFTQAGKAIRGTLESLLTPKGRESLVLKSVQVAAAMAQTLEAHSLLALIGAAVIEETRENKPRQPEALTSVVNRLCEASRTFALLHRDPQAYITMVDMARNKVNERGINTAGRQEKLIINKSSRGIVGRFKENITFEHTGVVGLAKPLTDEQVMAKQKVGVSALEAPLFDHDRYTKIDYMTKVILLGEKLALDWDVCGKYGLADCEYNYKRVQRKIKHHNGAETVLSLDQLMKEFSGFIMPGGGAGGGAFSDLGQQVFCPATQAAGVNHTPTIAEYAAHAAYNTRGRVDVTLAAQYKEKMLARILHNRHTYDMFHKQFNGQPNQPALQNVPADDNAFDAMFKGNGPAQAAARNGIAGVRLWQRAGSDLEYMLDNNVPLFVVMYFWSPNIAYNVGDHLYYAKSENSLVHLITPPMVAREQSAENRNYVIVTRMDHAPVMFESEALVRLPQVNVLGYHGGDEPGTENIWVYGNIDHQNTYITVASSTDRNTARKFSSMKSHFVVADVAGNPVWQHRMMDATGHFAESLNINTAHLAVRDQIKTAAHYDAFWKFKDGRSSDFDVRTATAEGVGLNTLMFDRDHFELNARTGTWVHMPGAGHRANIINDPDYYRICSGHTIDSTAVHASITRTMGVQSIVAPTITTRM